MFECKLKVSQVGWFVYGTPINTSSDATIYYGEIFIMLRDEDRKKMYEKAGYEVCPAYAANVSNEFLLYKEIR